MKPIGIIILLLCAFNSLKSQWENTSQSIEKQLLRITKIDTSFFIMGANYLYRCDDKVKNIILIKKDSIDFDNVMKFADTVLIVGHYYVNSFFRANIIAYKLFPGKTEVDTNWFNRGTGNQNGYSYYTRYKDSTIEFDMQMDTRPTNYRFWLAISIGDDDGGFHSAFGRGLFGGDSLNLRNCFIKDSLLVVLCNFPPNSLRTSTIIAKRNINKFISNYKQYDTIINLPRAKALYMFSDTSGIIVGDTYIARSTNYTTWIMQYQNSSCNLNQVWFTSKDTGYVVGSKNGKAIILKSVDGGMSWREQYCPVTAPLNDIKFTEDGKYGIIVGDSGTILRTTNGGGKNYIGINSVVLDNSSFHIFPNPATNQLIIELPDTYIQNTAIQFKIYEMKGQVLKQGVIKEKQTLLDIHNLENGLYFISIGEQAIKFIKQSQD